MSQYNYKVIRQIMFQNIEGHQFTRDPQKPSILRQKFNSRQDNAIIIRVQDISIAPVLTLQRRQVRQCRICLDNEQSQENKLVSHCRCNGSVQYVHDKCYRKWIEKQFESKDQRQRKVMISQGVQCELCRKQIYLDFQNQCKCNQFEKFIKLYNQNKLIFFTLLFLLIINVGCITFISYFSIANKINLNSNRVIFIIIICAYVVLTITAIVITYYFGNQYIVQKIWILQSYSKSPPQQIIKTNKIYPEQSIEQMQ